MKLEIKYSQDFKVRMQTQGYFKKERKEKRERKKREARSVI